MAHPIEEVDMNKLVLENRFCILAHRRTILKYLVVNLFYFA